MFCVTHVLHDACFTWVVLKKNPPPTGLPPLSGESGAGDTLKQFHAASSSLKSMCTGVTAAGIEDCRKACGGHGFLQSSGLPEFLGSYLQSCTVEGENHMLTQQVRGTTRAPVSVPRRRVLG